LNPALIAIGAGLFGFGGAIFYLLPLSLLSFNLTLLFNVFLGNAFLPLCLSIYLPAHQPALVPHMSSFPWCAPCL
jgi:hypothetical protein